MCRTFNKILLSVCLMSAGTLLADPVAPHCQQPATQLYQETEKAHKVLVIGDSMTGWMGERLNEYGRENGFEVATVVWDGSTISKWAASPNVAKIIADEKPDAILVCLGMNEMFERNPESRLKASTEKLLAQFGETPFLWIGPPSWPGHPEAKEFNEWLENEVGPEHYFVSSGLDLPRQSKSNPHPTRKGIEIWVDEIAETLPGSVLNVDTSEKPLPGKISRGNTFIYKRMKEKL